MKPKTFFAIGGWQSLLFCIGMYFVALFFSIFVCSSIFYVVNAPAPGGKAVAKMGSVHATKQVLASVTP